MNSVKLLMRICCSLVLAFNICACAQAQNVSSSTAPTNQKSNVDSPRELLVSQPDFMAEEILFSTEKRGNLGFVSGHQLLFKRAKKGQYYRRDTGLVVSFVDSANRTLRYGPKSKVLEEQKNERLHEGRWYDGADNPQYFAKKQGIKYEVVGTEKVLEKECIKIKATKEGAVPSGENDEEETVYFYVAKEMQNLVITTEIRLPNRRTSYVLRNVSFTVSDDLFQDVARCN